MFFFFQAEDGIRDLTVTGVQTCDLPIYRGRHDEHEVCVCKRVGDSGRGGRMDAQAGPELRPIGRCGRSEERRVGKEGGSWRWTVDSKKKRVSWELYVVFDSNTNVSYRCV